MTQPVRALGIFYKRPVPGRVKTRLCPPLTPSEAASLYAALLDDTIALAASLPLTRVVLFNGSERDPAAEGSPWRPEGAGEWPVHPQAGDDLGERMAEALNQLFDASPRPAAVALIGSDAPLLSRESILESFAALESGKGGLALIPTIDGGYALIGLARPAPSGLLSGIEWSRPTVREETLSRARKAGLTPFESADAAWDVDTPEDLERLGRELSHLESAADRRTAPATRRWLTTLNRLG